MTLAGNGVPRGPGQEPRIGTPELRYHRPGRIRRLLRVDRTRRPQPSV